MEPIHWIIIGVVIGIIIISLVVTLTIILVKKNKLAKLQNQAQQQYNSLYSLLYEACGGKENIDQVNSIGSRVVIYFKDNSLIKKDMFTKDKIDNAIVSSNKVTLTVGSQADALKDDLLHDLGMLK